MTNAIPMHSVVSSQLSYIGYDEVTSTLYVTFKNGTTYKYENVTEQVFNELKESSSIGKYFNSIKNNYTYSKV